MSTQVVVIGMFVVFAVWIFWADYKANKDE